ncbi:hypothetical protein WJX81_003324 [Elliptochloris bilobata]|uniref:Tetratricopeptide repeat protein n=1 Tax=Elliptochloris bilobata TaxID=381761 RepID=A0AAW1SL03_9CHLO
MSLEMHQDDVGNPPACTATLATAGVCAARCGFLYSAALELARGQDYAGARRAFQECVEICPSYGKAWVSWAQMEKRSRKAGAGDPLARCRMVLQQGLSLNPDSAPLCQAWGLMELQRGNVLAAVLLLERSVAHDPRCSPVLRWKAVRTARQTVGSRRRLRALGPQTGGFA